jgi:MFS family permease
MTGSPQSGWLGRAAAWRRLPSTVIALGTVSFLTDLSSEMIYPLLPLFLASVLGAGAVALGAIEGVAESTAALLKVFSGIWTDRTGKRKRLIVAGYSLAGAARPLIGLATAWFMVLALRFVDRIGKGLRTSPRDALLADVTAPSRRGEAFGFHRAMDHAGAVVGPLVAAALLRWADVPLRHVFLLAAIPAALVVVILLGAVHEPKRVAQEDGVRGHFGDLGRDFRLLLLAVFVFTLGNSTDAFLLLRLSEAGVGAHWIAVLWSAHHVVKMFCTYAGGRFSDRFGRRQLVLCGWLLYAATYVAFGVASSPGTLVVVFLVYGVYFGLTEPVERAWVADLVPARVRGTAFGFYNGAVGLAALPASLLFGVLWQMFGSATAFLVGAALAVAASGCLFFLPSTGTAVGESQDP